MDAPTAWWEPFFEVVDDPLPETNRALGFLSVPLTAGTYLVSLLPVRILDSFFSIFKAIWPPSSRLQPSPPSPPRTLIEEWVADSAIPAGRAAITRAERTRQALAREMTKSPRKARKGAVPEESPAKSGISHTAHIPLINQVFSRGHVECFFAALWVLVLCERVRIAHTTPRAEDLSPRFFSLLLFSAAITLGDRVREHLVLPVVPELAARDAWMAAVDLAFDALLVGWVFRGVMAAWAEQDGAVQRFQERLERERELRMEMSAEKEKPETPKRVLRRMPRRHT